MQNRKITGLNFKSRQSFNVGDFVRIILILFGFFFREV